MYDRVPDHRREAVRNVVEALDGLKRVVLTTHLNADGDGCGSEVALACWLRARGTEAFIVNPTPYPDVFRFLLPDEGWVVEAKDERARELCASADMAVVLDTGEVPRIGRVKPLIDTSPKVVIDHHRPGDQPIDGVSFRDPEASATGEMVFDIFAATDGPWDEHALLGMYVAVLTDTGSFRFSNASEQAHAVVGRLIGLGVDPAETYRRVYGTYPLRRIRLLQHALPTLEVHEAGRVAWMIVPREAYESLDAKPDDLEGFVDYPRGIEGVEVGLLFRSTDAGGTKISFRSNGPVDVNELARRFGGGGHIKAAGAYVEGPLEAVREEVVLATVQATETAGP